MQPRDRVADSSEHPLDLVLAAFVHAQLDAVRAEAASSGARGRTVVELEPSFQAAKRVVGRLALDIGLVDLLDLVARVGEPVRELAVVREQEGTRRVGVEATDRDDARLVVDEPDDRGPTLRVARSGDGAGRLVQEHVGQPLQLDPAPVELDPVAALDERVQLPRLAVDRHAAGLDQLVGLAPGGDAGSREVGVEPHLRHYRRVPHYVSLMRWTSKGVAGLPAWRERVEEGERIVDEAGGKLVGVYVTLGRYDVVEIFEAPNDETAYGIVLELARHGNVRTETLRAFTREEAEAIVRES